MIRAYALPRRLIVEARDLDTDARAHQELDVDAPADQAGQRAQLVGIVARLHPEARMRSFGNGRRLSSTPLIWSSPTTRRRVSQDRRSFRARGEYGRSAAAVRRLSPWPNRKLPVNASCAQRPKRAGLAPVRRRGLICYDV
jgi:hypothetical protein